MIEKMNETGVSEVRASKTRLMFIQQIIIDQKLFKLDVHCFFQDLGDCTQNTHGSIIAGFSIVVLLKERYDLCCFKVIRNSARTNRLVDYVSIKTAAPSFKNLGEILSSPVLLFGMSFKSSVSTKSSLTEPNFSVFETALPR